MSESFNPFFYINDPAVMAQLNRLLHEYKCGKITLDKVLEYIKSIDSTIADTIAKMLDDGKIEEILEKIAEPILNNLMEEFQNELDETKHELLTQFQYVKTEYLDPPRIHYIRKSNGKNFTFYKDRPYYSWLQGACRYKVGGVDYIALLFNALNGNYNRNNNCELCVYQVGQSTLLKSAVLSVGHGQAITYNPEDGYFYISYYMWAESNGSNSSSYNIRRVKESDLTTSDEDVHTIQHSCMGLDWIDGEGLVGSDGDVVVSIDWNNSKSEVMYTIPPKYGLNTYRPHGNGFCMNKDYYCVQAFIPAMVMLFDRKTNELAWIYKTPLVMNQADCIGEVESIQLDDDGTFTMFACHSLQSPMYGTMYVTPVYSQNLKTMAQYPTIEPPSHVDSFRYVPVSMYVDIDVDDANPDGSQAHPYQYVQEALNYLTYSPYTFGWVYVKGTSYSTITWETPGKHVQLQGVNSNWDAVEDDKKYVNVGELIVRGGSLTAVGLRFAPYCTSEDRGCVVVTYTRDVTIGACDFFPEDPNGNNTTRAVYARMGEVNLATHYSPTDFQSAHDGKYLYAVGNGGVVNKLNWA